MVLLDQVESAGSSGLTGANGSAGSEEKLEVGQVQSM
jgi:hypothetical protein